MWKSIRLDYIGSNTADLHELPQYKGASGLHVCDYQIKLVVVPLWF